MLREALALWRGPALADLAYEPFAQAAIVRLEDLHLLAVERRIDADLALGQQAQLVRLRRRLHEIGGSTLVRGLQEVLDDLAAPTARLQRTRRTCPCLLRE